MNREVMADELDRQIEGMLSGKRTIGADSDPLLAVAAELPMLPDREFRESLKQILVEADAHSFSAEFGNAHPTKSALGGAPSSVVAHASNGKSEWHQPTSLGALTPLFGSKHTGLFPADQRSFLVSFASHAALIALIASGIFVGNVTIVKRTFLTSEITFPAAGHGGGGSGDRSAIQATKGTPPKFSERQVTPPVIVVQNEKPRLPVESTVVGPPQIVFPQSNRIGDLVSTNIVIPSNGTGEMGGAGDGRGTGLGIGDGPGVGPGKGGGYGGNQYQPHLGITAPRAIYDPEPEYSEEARKVKHQGIVVLSLVVDAQGHTRDIRVARSLGMGLDEKAIEAVRKWKFSPGSSNGVPVPMQVNIEVNFRLY
jgi:TonB family protein